MIERIRLRTFAVDDTSEIRAKHVGVLTELLAKKRLALANTTDPAEHRRLHVAIAGLEQAIDRARQDQVKE